MSDPKLTPKFELSLDGSPVDAALAESVIVIRVHQHLEMADCIEVRLSNNDLAWTESDAVVEGKKISVKLGYEEGDFEEVFKGEVVRRDCEFPMRGPAIVTVVGFDNEHRLKRGKHSRSFLDMKDSDIVSQLAGDAGLSADVEATTTTHKYLLQDAKTNLSFLRERAAAVGFNLTVDRDNAKLTFKKPDPSNESATLTWGENLLYFNPRMSAAGQLSKVTVRGWDMTKKEMIEGSADASKIKLKLDGTESGADLAEKAFSKKEALLVDIPVRETGEAEAMAESAINQSADGFCQGEASCQGNPLVEAGTTVTIEGVGKRAGGQYYVLKTLHHLEPSVGYSTHLSLKRATQSQGETGEFDPPHELPPREETEYSSETFVEVRVRSDTGESLEGASYTVTLPDGSTQSGTLDETQTIRVEGIKDPGEAKVEINLEDDFEALGE